MGQEKNDFAASETGNGEGSVSASQKERPRSPLTGAPVPGGRPKGVPNKITKTFKQAAEKAFEKGGGVDWLVKMMNGTASDRAAVLQLFGRLIPAQLQGEVNHSVKVQLDFASGRNLVQIPQADTHSAGAKQIPHENQDVIDVDDISAGTRCSDGAENLKADPKKTCSNENENHSQ